MGKCKECLFYKKQYIPLSGTVELCHIPTGKLNHNGNMKVWEANPAVKNDNLKCKDFKPRPSPLTSMSPVEVRR